LAAPIAACNLGAEEYQRWTSPDGCLDAVLMDEYTDVASADTFVLHIVPKGRVLSERATYPDRESTLSAEWAVGNEVLTGSRFESPSNATRHRDLVKWAGKRKVEFRFREGAIYHFRSQIEVEAPGDCGGTVQIRLVRIGNPPAF